MIVLLDCRDGMITDACGLGEPHVASKSLPLLWTGAGEMVATVAPHEI